jgi:hypothetical protein
MEGLLSETVNHIFAEKGIFMGPDPRAWTHKRQPNVDLTRRAPRLGGAWMQTGPGYGYYGGYRPVPWWVSAAIVRMSSPTP